MILVSYVQRRHIPSLLAPSCLPPAGCLFLRLSEVPQSPPQPFLQPNQRLVPKVSLCPTAAVVVVGAGQGHPHGREGGVDGDQGAEEGAEALEEDREVVDE